MKFKPIKNNEDRGAVIEGFVLGALFMFLLCTLAVMLHPLIGFCNEG